MACFNIKFFSVIILFATINLFVEVRALAILNHLEVLIIELTLLEVFDSVPLSLILVFN